MQLSQVLGRRRNVMKRLIVVLVAFLVLAPSSVAQDTVLDFLREEADIIVHVNIIDVQGGVFNEIGVEECSALCSVIQTIKGSVQDGERIRFRYNRFHFLEVLEPALVEIGQEYIVFLKGTSGGLRFPSDDELHRAYELLDRWVGVLPYHFHLGTRL